MPGPAFYPPTEHVYHERDVVQPVLVAVSNDDALKRAQAELAKSQAEVQRLKDAAVAKDVVVGPTAAAPGGADKSILPTLGWVAVIAAASVVLYRAATAKNT